MLAQCITLMMSRNTFNLHGAYTYYIYTCMYTNILCGSHRNHMVMWLCAFTTQLLKMSSLWAKGCMLDDYLCLLSPLVEGESHCTLLFSFEELFIITYYLILLIISSKILKY